jgi:hypothetical protein
VAFISTPSESAYRSLEARGLLPEKRNLEREVEALKLRKTQIPEQEYYRQLEDLLIDLSALNEKIRELEGRP